MNKSTKTMIGIVAGMLVIKLFDLIVSPNHVFAGRTAEFSWIEFGVVAVLGFLAVLLSSKTALPDMWDVGIGNQDRILKSLGIGILMGVVFTIFDFFFAIGDISVGWPLSIPFYLWGGVSQEIIMHFFPLALLLWVFVSQLFKGKHYNIVYWVISTILSVISAVGMVGAFANPDIPLSAKYAFVPAVIGLLVFASEMVLFKMMKKYGFLSSLFTRFGFYTIWHVLWPVLFY